MSTALKNEKEQKVVDAVGKQLYIGGTWRDGSEGGSLEVETMRVAATERRDGC